MESSEDAAEYSYSAAVSESSLEDSIPGSPQVEYTASDNDEYKPSSSQKKNIGSRGRKQSRRATNDKRIQKSKRGRGKGVVLTSRIRGKGVVREGRGKPVGISSDLVKIESNTKRMAANGPDEYIRTLVVTDAADKFMSSSLLCLICGSIGKDLEGSNVVCMTCAQTYHTYCVGLSNLSLNTRGWRCVDCVACEECGKKTDEPNMLLCEGCNMTFHTYCLNPPLQYIPHSPWLCRWCATCYRCNKRINKTGIEYKSLEGLCDVCFSLQRCPKCRNIYKIGDLLLKCQRCHQWFHAACEDCQNEEQAENASENYFRCSSCRPKIFNDSQNMPVIYDNIMISRNAADNLTSLDRFFNSDGFLRPKICQTSSENDIPPTFEFYCGARGGRGFRRARRLFRVGVGGFIAKVPRNRLTPIKTMPSTHINTDDTLGLDSKINDVEQDEKAKTKRHRKSRQPKLEDIYTNVIQESFFAAPTVDHKILSADPSNISEPLLSAEYKKTNFDNLNFMKEHRCELSEQSSEKLRAPDVQDMLGDMLNDTNLEFVDFESLNDFDFADLIDDGYDEDTESHCQEGKDSHGSSRNYAAGTSMGSALEASSEKYSKLIDQRRVLGAGSKRISNSLYQATERWEEDEPLGDKATKAAVLYANVHHADLKVKYPDWSNRVKIISRVWRELNSEKRQEFVEMARKNRANCPTYRRRGRRSTLIYDSLPVNNQEKQSDFTDSLFETPRAVAYAPASSTSPTTSSQTFSTNTPTSSKATPDYSTNFSALDRPPFVSLFKEDVTSPASQKHSTPIVDSPRIFSVLDSKNVIEMQPIAQNFSSIEAGKKYWGDEVERFKKLRRSLTAKCRQLQKNISTITDEPSSSKDSFKIELNVIRGEMEVVKKSLFHCQSQLTQYKNQIKESTDSAQVCQQLISQSSFNENGLLEDSKEFKSETVYSSSAVASTSTSLKLGLPVKSNRGRKRKIALDRPRALILGKIAYASLLTQVDMDVYDVVDNLINNVDLFTQRIGKGSLSMPTCSDKPKQKRRRVQVVQKHAIQPQSFDDLNGLEIMKQRIQQKIADLPVTRYSLEQYNMHNKRNFHFLDQTLLPLLPQIIFSKDFKFGNYCLTFLSDPFERGCSTFDIQLNEDVSMDLENFNSQFPDGKVEIRLTILPNAIPINDIMSTLFKLLQIPQPPEYTIETPPPTPTNDTNNVKSVKSEPLDSIENGDVLINGSIGPITPTTKDYQPDHNRQTGCLTLECDENSYDGLNLFLSRENKVFLTDLLSIVASSEKELRHGEYKWKGHGWMLYDELIQKSFSNQRGMPTPLQIKTYRNDELRENTDMRECLFCKGIGDGAPNLTGRLLNIDANEWIHVNCALWSAEVHETKNGALINVENAVNHAKHTLCCFCQQLGASVRCYRLDCASKDVAFHFNCAIKSGGKFAPDKTFYCASHNVRTDLCVETFNSFRRIYINRDENRLIAKIFNHSLSVDLMLRVGNLIFYKLGQLLPEQLKSFHSGNHIFPIGYKVERIFWSTKNISALEHYLCEINEDKNAPKFRVEYINGQQKGSSASAAWQTILTSVSRLREENAYKTVKLHQNLLNGETLFGLNESSITKMTESLPGVDQLYTYSFKHGGFPMLDLPLAVNPSGCVRCEPCLRTLIKRHTRTLISSSPKKELSSRNNKNSFYTEVVSRGSRSARSISDSRFSPSGSKMDEETIRAYRASGISERMLQGPYLRSEPIQALTQFKELQRNWKSTVYLARSKIQGMGLYAKRDIDMNSMIVEYLGEMIRSEVGEMREKRYFAQNRGVYMFRVDDDWFVDATMCGGCARYINHSCDPNCSTKILSVGDEKKIIIVANRPIKAGEELTYDYQFEIEDTSEKIPCLCGAPNCMKWVDFF